MKHLGRVVIACVLLVLSGCGEDDKAQPVNSSSNDESTSVSLTRPDIQPPPTPPAKLVIKDLNEGVGSPSKVGDELTTEYYAVDMAGRMRFSSWDRTPPPHFSFDLGSSGYMQGLEDGLEDMRVGGRRELLIPSRMSDTQGPLFYVIDLLEINRTGRCWAVLSLAEMTSARRDEIREVCDSRTRVP